MFLPALPDYWIDGFAFGAQVLRGGENPWTRPDELGLFHRELASLLSFDVIEINVAAAIEALADVEMSDDKKVTAEVFLRRRDFAELLSRGIAAVSGAVGARPVALSLPGPGVVARRFHTEGEIDDDLLDDLSMELTQLLRSVYTECIKFLRVSEVDETALSTLGPLTNTAAHYQCATLLLLRNSASNATKVSGFDLVFRDGDISFAGEGIVVPQTWWSGADAPPKGNTFFTELPAALVPEAALSRLSELIRPAV